jgi:hypothetical protein
MAENVTVALPDDLARQARAVAASRRQTVEDVLLDWIRQGGAQVEGTDPAAHPLVERSGEAGAVRGNGSARGEEYPVADFLEPVRYEWTEAGYEVRQILKRYSGQTHADY